ncbi:Uncharacterised protein [Vibrio cholerae]|nr:Uncharacterised protein [Vibrio cholerae]
MKRLCLTTCVQPTNRCLMVHCKGFIVPTSQRLASKATQKQAQVHTMQHRCLTTLLN